MKHNVPSRDVAARKLTDAELGFVSGGDKAGAVAQAKADADLIAAVLRKYGVIP